ncbi:NEDD8-conjugating enzyme Ubc12 isoform X1 [Eretmochelys imbricata]
MIKLFSLKQQKKEEESAGGTKGSSKKASAAQLRIQKDINELNLPKTCEIDFSDQDDLLNFKLVICPDEGFYKGGKFVFSFKVGQGYPHDPPKVKCETMVYHPNIDLEGNVCLNILREDWKPVLTINSIIYGLQYLFLVLLGYAVHWMRYITCDRCVYNPWILTGAKPRRPPEQRGCRGPSEQQTPV